MSFINSQKYFIVADTFSNGSCFERNNISKKVGALNIWDNSLEIDHRIEPQSSKYS